MPAAMDNCSACPVVSVVMPAYNARRYVREAVESILTQTFQDFELIIIDDGSTDGTNQILEMLARRDARIRLVSRENRGIAVTRNEGVGLARGEFIAVMDADDVAMPERLAEEVTFLRNHPDHVCVSTGARLIDAKGRWLPYPYRDPADDASIQSVLLKGATPMYASGAMMRRNAVMQVGGYDDELSTAEDYDLYLKLGEVGKLANLPEELVCYRIHSSSVSQTKAQVQRARVKLAWQRAIDRRKVSASFEERPLPRPSSDRQSKFSHALVFGWWALDGGAAMTALVLGMQAIGTLPLDSRGWVLTVRSLRRVLRPKKATAG